MKPLVFAAATSLVVIPLSSTALARPMTPEDVAKIESLGAVAVSPDGSRIAFTSVSLPDVSEGEENGGFNQVLKVATGPNEATIYLPDDISPGGIAFSPDGSMISFTWSKDGEDRAVWGIPIAGGTYRKLAEVADSQVLSYVWNPNGNSIFMLTTAAEDEQRTEQRKAGFNSIVYEEEARFPRLFQANISDAVDAEPREISVPGYVTAFDVTPDGLTGVLQSKPTPQIDDTYTSLRVHIIDLSNGVVKAIVPTPGKLGDVEVSPDGTQLSMIAGIDINDPAETTLHLVDLSTGNYRALNEGAPEATVDAEWMSNGRLATIMHVGAQSRLRIYNADGTVRRETDPGSLILTSVSSAGDRLVFSANSPHHPSELFVLKEPGRSNIFERWTDHNPWLSDITFGTQRTYRYTARDGQEVEGILIEPIDGIPDGGAPTIMNVHGGPEAHESNGWLTAYSKPGHVAAGQGYAVFLPNYRGSTAYGTAFSKQHQGNYTDPEFADIVDAKYALVADGITDPNRTGITGGSYGGYASAWGATYHSDEYAASVMFVGISDQTSKFGTTDIPHEMYNVHSRAWPWDGWQKMLEVSPIYHTDKANTPILIMHGQEDTRVDPSQSMELYRFIKVRKPDVPVRMVFYPGEGHGNRMAGSRYDYNLRMMEWFDTYLRTGDRRAAMPPPRPELSENARGAEAGGSTD